MTQEYDNSNEPLNTLPIEHIDHMEHELIFFNNDLKKANERLTELATQKDIFISIAAHELKTPITSIQGFAQLLQDEKLLSDIERSKHYLNLINTNTNKLYDLILDMVDAFKIINNVLKLNIEDVNLYDMMDDLKELFEEKIKSKGITPEFYISDKLPIVLTDNLKVIRTLKNLLSNSINFTKSGTISLRIYRDKESVCFEVKDTGQGIPQENQKYIFSSFYQVDISMTRKVGGIGLGLFICKGLVERMGGKIWFESEYERGSKFSFSIPLVFEETRTDIKVDGL